MSTKKCPYCAEEIQVEAIKCRYCGEFLQAEEEEVEEEPLSPFSSSPESAPELRGALLPRAATVGKWLLWIPAIALGSFLVYAISDYTRHRPGRYAQVPPPVQREEPRLSRAQVLAMCDALEDRHLAMVESYNEVHASLLRARPGTPWLRQSNVFAANGLAILPGFTEALELMRSAGAPNDMRDYQAQSLLYVALVAEANAWEDPSQLNREIVAVYRKAGFLYKRMSNGSCDF